MKETFTLDEQQKALETQLCGSFKKLICGGRGVLCIFIQRRRTARLSSIVYGLIVFLLLTVTINSTRFSPQFSQEICRISDSVKLEKNGKSIIRLCCGLFHGG